VLLLNLHSTLCRRTPQSLSEEPSPTKPTPQRSPAHENEAKPLQKGKAIIKRTLSTTSDKKDRAEAAGARESRPSNLGVEKGTETGAGDSSGGEEGG